MLVRNSKRGKYKHIFFILSHERKRHEFVWCRSWNQKSVWLQNNLNPPGVSWFLPCQTIFPGFKENVNKTLFLSESRISGWFHGYYHNGHTISADARMAFSICSDDLRIYMDVILVSLCCKNWRVASISCPVFLYMRLAADRLKECVDTSSISR